MVMRDGVNGMRVEIIDKQQVFQEYVFEVNRVRLRFERFDGTMSDEIARVTFERGDSVAAVLHDPQANTVLLTKQFRYPAFTHGDGWILELPAGVVEQGEDPHDTIKRELIEEIGYQVESLRPISTFYVSPGANTERIHLYYASVTPAQQVSEGGGVADESENIRRIAMPVREALFKITTGDICDAKTIIGLQWLQVHVVG